MSTFPDEEEELELVGTESFASFPRRRYGRGPAAEGGVGQDIRLRTFEMSRTPAVENLVATSVEI